jgi:ABC-type arginine/histidine transport system permease subunit
MRVPDQKTQIVVVGGGAGGLELVRKLGAKYGRKKHDIILIDRNLTHIWKPLLHEVAAGSLDANLDEVGYGGHAVRWGYRFFQGSIESIDRGQTEAGIAMGFTRVGTFRHIVLPQALQRILPVYKGEFISMVKMTSIVGYVAVEDLTKASDIIRSRTFDAFFPLVTVAVLYFLVSWVLIQVLGYLERRTDPMQRRAAEART